MKVKKKKTTTTEKTSEYWYDEEAANRAVSFFEKYLTFPSGRLGGTPFILSEWQRERIVKPLFGWKKKNGFRKYTKLFLYVPRKNGKTPLAVGILMAAFFLDNEIGAQVYNAANDESQANLSFDMAMWMIKQKGKLSNACKLLTKSIYRKKTHAIWRALSKESKTKDGFNIHAACLDEVHEWSKRDLYDKIKTGSLARSQPLHVITTTAGTYDKTAIWMEIYEYCKKIKKGEVIDESYLVVMYEPEDEELLSQDFDPFDENLWKRLNPGWGESVDVDMFKQLAREAKESPSFLNVFKRYNLNIITKAIDVFIPGHIWSQGNFGYEIKELDYYKGRECFLATDLSSYEDLVSLSAVFPNEDGSIDVKMWYWVTEEKATKRKTQNEADYFTWRDMGYVDIVPGNRHDYDLIRNKIHEINRAGIKVIVLGYDDWNASQFIVDVAGDGVPTNPWAPQNMKLWHKPTRNLESMAINKLIRHYGNPVLAWNVENISIKYNGEYIKPDKAKSRDKIDGAIALIIAIGEWMGHKDESYNFLASDFIK